MKCHKIEESIYHNFSEPFFCLKNTKEKWWSKQLLMNFLLSNSSINQLVIAALNHSKKFLYQESRWDIYSSVSWWSKCWFYHTTSGIFLAWQRSEFYIKYYWVQLGKWLKEWYLGIQATKLEFPLWGVWAHPNKPRAELLFLHMERCLSKTSN